MTSEPTADAPDTDAPALDAAQPVEGSHAGAPDGNTERLKRYFEHLFANSRDMMNLFSLAESKIIMLNRAAEEATGYSLDELSTSPVDALYPAEEHGKLAHAFERLTSTGYSSEKLRMYVRGGELRDIWTRSYVVQHEPEVICLVHTIDITEEKRKQARELRNAKLATLGQSSATLAHELKNALQSMQFSLGTLRMQLAKNDQERAQHSLARVERAAAHMDDVITGIERSAHSSATGRSHASLVSAVQNAVSIMRGYLATKGVEVSIEFGMDLPLVWCDRPQLEQILLILIKNAAQAMASRDTRRLHIALRNEADNVRLEVSDTGGGMPPEVEAKLFQAFTTTKSHGLGSGLGLVTARQLALANEVGLTLKSEPGVGTTFSLLFSKSAGPTEINADDALGGRIVLVVGDDPSMLSEISSSLASAGARVLLATSASDGLQLLRVHAVEMVLCDDTMFPVTGREFADEARQSYRGQICLVVNSPEDAMAKPISGVDFIVHKPLVGSQLVATLSRLLA